MSRLHSRFVPALVAFSTLSLVVLTGCGAASSFSNPTTSAHVTGKVFGGQQPVAGSTVTVWSAGITGYGSAATSLATTLTADDGTFNFASGTYTCPTPGTQVYITAQGGTAVAGGPVNPNIALATGLGACSAAQSATVEINEVTTAATAFALAQFFTPTLGTSSTDAFGTASADLTAFTNSNEYTIPTLVDVPSGLVQPNTTAITIDAAKIYSIANTLASCVNDAAGFANCTTLYGDTTPPGGTAPTDTLQAAVQIALRPYQNIHGLYVLATKTPPFTGLYAQPNDWTVGVSYTSSNYGLSIATTATSATSASIDIDASGKIWFPTNLANSTGVANFDPTATAFNGPYLTGHLNQPQYVAIDSRGYVWATDVSSSSPIIAYTDTASPGSYKGLNLVTGVLGPVAADAVGDVFFVTDRSDGPQLASISDPTTLDGTIFGTFNEPPTGLVATESFVYASTSGINTHCNLEYSNTSSTTIIEASTSSNCTSGGVAFAEAADDSLGMATSLDEFCFLQEQGCGGPPSAFVAAVNLPEGVTTDGLGNEWIANSGNASVFTFGGVFTNYANTSTVAYLHDSNHGSTMTVPYAIAIDGSGNVWIANAGCVSTTTTACTPGAFVLSELIGAAGPTVTPLSSQMADGGFLVGQVPGTVVPVSAGAAHPQRFGHAANGQSAPATWSEATGKPLMVVR